MLWIDGCGDRGVGDTWPEAPGEDSAGLRILPVQAEMGFRSWGCDSL
jgi:hypothetical protein